MIQQQVVFSFESNLRPKCLNEMIRYGTHIQDILYCDCFYDEIYFMLRHKVVCQKFEERFEDLEKIAILK